MYFHWCLLIKSCSLPIFLSKIQYYWTRIYWQTERSSFSQFNHNYSPCNSIRLNSNNNSSSRQSHFMQSSVTVKWSPQSRIRRPTREKIKWASIPLKWEIVRLVKDWRGHRDLPTATATSTITSNTSSWRSSRAHRPSRLPSECRQQTATRRKIHQNPWRQTLNTHPPLSIHRRHQKAQSSTELCENFYQKTTKDRPGVPSRWTRTHIKAITSRSWK